MIRELVLKRLVNGYSISVDTGSGTKTFVLTDVPDQGKEPPTIHAALSQALTRGLELWQRDAMPNWQPPPPAPELKKKLWRRRK